MSAEPKDQTRALRTISFGVTEYMFNMIAEDGDGNDLFNHHVDPSVANAVENIIEHVQTPHVTAVSYSKGFTVVVYHIWKMDQSSAEVARLWEIVDNCRFMFEPNAGLPVEEEEAEHGS